MKLITDIHGITNNTYVRTVAPDNVVKFKELGKLAQEAIDLDASHLEDDVVGLFVMTNNKA